MRVHEYVPGQQDSPVQDVCVSFNGGAWRGIFFLGAVQFLQEKFSEEELMRWSFCGVSAGSCYALALALNFPFDSLKKLLFRACGEARRRTLGVAFRVNTICGRVIEEILGSFSEEYVVSRLKGRFAITFSSLSGWKVLPFIAYDFSSKKEVLDATIGSSNIPLFSSLTYVPLLGKRRAFDGGMTDLGCVPLLPSKKTVYCISFGDASRILPPGVSIDICETPPVSYRECFRTPASDQDLLSTLRKGYLSSSTFFSQKKCFS